MCTLHNKDSEAQPAHAASTVIPRVVRVSDCPQIVTHCRGIRLEKRTTVGSPCAKKHHLLNVISGFNRLVNEVYAVLGFYTA